MSDQPANRMTVTIRGLRPCPSMTYEGMTLDEARRAYHDSFPGWHGVIASVEVTEDEEATDG